MRPLLALIPAMPATWVMPLALGSLGIGALFAWRFRSLTPVAIAILIGFLAWLWSRSAIPVHSYGLFLVIGFFASATLACLEARRRGLDPNLILDLAMPLLVVSIVACRALYFVIYPHQWEGWGAFLRIWNGGLSFHGAIIAAVGVLAFFSWSRRVPMGTLADLIAPGAFLGYAIGRIGCFLNGCCYGHPTDLPWAVVFPMETNRSLLTPPCHPAQLYSTLMGLALFGVMWSARTRPTFNRFAGQLFLLLMALYAVERFVMEIFRNGATAPLAFGLEWLTQAQFASIVGLVVIGALWWLGLRSPQPELQAATPVAPSESPSDVSAR